MNHIKSRVVTINVGLSASMASFLLCGGTKGSRLALPNSRVMIHQPMGGAQGQAADIAIVAKEILKTREKLNKIYVSHTGKDVESIERVMDRDTYFTAEEAKEFGVVDEVVAARERPGKPSDDDEEPLERAA